jgi:hypothetical protein
MKPQEFLLWLKGFVDAVDGVPTQNQWDILKKSLEKIKDNPTSPFSSTGANVVYTSDLSKKLLKD